MRKEYNFSGAVKNPYAKRLKRQITIRLDDVTVAYFKALAEEIGLSYQNLMNFYLRECALDRKRPSMKWVEHVEQTDRRER